MRLGRETLQRFLDIHTARAHGIINSRSFIHNFAGAELGDDKQAMSI